MSFRKILKNSIKVVTRLMFSPGIYIESMLDQIPNKDI